MISQSESPAAQRVGPAQVALAVATLAVFCGGLAIRSKIVFGLVVVGVVLIPMERVFALHPQRIFRPGWATDLVHFVVDNLISGVGLVGAVVVVGTILRALVPGTVHAAVASQPVAQQIVEAFVLVQVLQYAGHRATHAVPLLWRFHKVHHSIIEMDWLASARVHPIDSVFSQSCIVLPLYALGFSKATFAGLLAIVTFQTIFAIFIHANVRFSFGPLRWVIATPAFHHWHHANDPEHRNTNFAGQFPWIDALFGTFYLPEGRWPARYGLDEPAPPGYLRQLAWSFKD